MRRLTDGLGCAALAAALFASPLDAQVAIRGGTVHTMAGPAIENGTDPGLINPRLQQLQADKDVLIRQRNRLEAPDRLNPDDIAKMLEELGGMASVLKDATPAEKTSIYQELGLRLVYRPEEKTLVATADLGRVVSRVGGGT
jgi:site-specific DNA recombinase